MFEKWLRKKQPKDISIQTFGVAYLQSERDVTTFTNRLHTGLIPMPGGNHIPYVTSDSTMRIARNGGGVIRQVIGMFDDMEDMKKANDARRLMHALETRRPELYRQFIELERDFHLDGTIQSD